MRSAQESSPVGIVDAKHRLDIDRNEFSRPSKSERRHIGATLKALDPNAALLVILVGRPVFVQTGDADFGSKSAIQEATAKDLYA